MSPLVDSWAAAPGVLPSLACLDDPLRVAAVDRVVAQGGSGLALQRLATLAARLTQTPQAQVGLIAEQCIVAAVHGVEPAGPERMIDLRDSVCAVALVCGTPLVVADAQRHPWVAHLPAVTSGEAASLLAVPLVDQDGQALGALWVNDRVPRDWSAADLAALSAVGDAVLAEFAAPTTPAQTGFLAGSGLLASTVRSAADIGSFDLDLTSGLLRCDERLTAFFDLPRSGGTHPVSVFLDRIHPDDLERVERALEVARAEGGEYHLEHRVVRRSGEVRWLAVHGVVLADIVGRASRLVG